MKAKIIQALIALLCVMQLQANAQTFSTEDIHRVITADSLKSGNYKDLVTSFFQLAFDNLTGKEKSLRFTSNPFAIMARANPELFSGDNWYRYRHLRQLNFDLAYQTDSAFHNSSFAAGIKYALVNKRDLTVSKLYFKRVSEDPAIKFKDKLGDELAAIESNLSGDAQEQFVSETNKLTGHDAQSITFKQLSKTSKDLINQYVDKLSEEDRSKSSLYFFTQHPDIKPYEVWNKSVEDIRQEFLQKPLWTVYTNAASYANNADFKTISVGSDFLRGLGASKNSTLTYEADIKALYKIADDSLLAGHDLERQTLSLEPGINLVLRNKNSLKSFLEFKIGGGYYHVFSPRAGEKADSVTLNGEIRLRIYDDIWVPFAIKYDPEHGNVFGFLNIAANFTGIASLLRKVGS